MTTEAGAIGFADWFETVYAYVRNVPPGKVVTYGQVAGEITSVALTPRQVGTAMRYAPPDVPWQRVVGAGGYLPIFKRSPELGLLQQRLLQQEGAFFRASDQVSVDLARSQWIPPSS